MLLFLHFSARNLSLFVVIKSPATIVKWQPTKVFQPPDYQFKMIIVYTYRIFFSMMYVKPSNESFMKAMEDTQEPESF